jgi:CheY-like chemotaxis protein
MTADAVEEPLTDGDNSLSAVLSVERTRSVRDALAQLPVHQQRLLELSFDAGLSHSKIAAVLRQPLGTVKTHIRQALADLRDQTHNGEHEPPKWGAEHAGCALPFTIVGEESLRTLPRSGTKQLENIDAELRGLRILLVDDDEEALKLTSAVIKRFGAIADAHSSASSALNEQRMCESDVMIVDLVMPLQDGYSFLDAARALATGRRLELPPAIAFTASASENERSRVRLAGFHSYLTKPVHPLALLSTVASLVPRRR